jgi:chorismate lyase/3-hydroxybenzoate synthase
MAAAEGSEIGLCVDYSRDARRALDANVLAALVFDVEPAPPQDARIIHVGIAAADGRPAVEVWRTGRAATCGVSGPIRYATAGDFLFGCLEVREQDHGGLSAAAEAAYHSLMKFQRARAQRHLLRIWNHIDAINAGDGDLERYRQFCSGRARGLGDMRPDGLPAGTAVGRRIAAGSLQVCWLAGTRPGLPVGNPRQVHAYQYPRQYGPAPPSFSRAMLLPDDELMGSGTASIVGHESRHEGNIEAQIDETLNNLRELRQAGERLAARGGLAGPDDASIAAKVYLRRGENGPSAAARIRAGLPGIANLLLLEADICRRELLVEIECTWGRGVSVSASAHPRADEAAG